MTDLALSAQPGKSQGRSPRRAKQSLVPTMKLGLLVGPHPAHPVTPGPKCRMATFSTPAEGVVGAQPLPDDEQEVTDQRFALRMRPHCLAAHTQLAQPAKQLPRIRGRNSRCTRLEECKAEIVGTAIGPFSLPRDGRSSVRPQRFALRHEAFVSSLCLGGS